MRRGAATDLVRLPSRPRLVASCVIAALLFLRADAYSADEVDGVLQLYVSYLRDSESPERREEAATELGKLGFRASPAVPLLGRRLREDLGEGVRKACAIALTRIGPAARSSLPDLRLTLGDPDPAVYAYALIGIAGIERPSIAAADLASALYHPDPLVRWTAARTLGMRPHANGSAAKQLMVRIGAWQSEKAVRPPAEEILLAEIEALGRIREGKQFAATLPVLVPLKEQQSPELRAAIIEALARQGVSRKEAVDAARVLMVGATKDARIQGSYAAMHFWPPPNELAPEVLVLLDDKESDVRSNAPWIAGVLSETPNSKLIDTKLSRLATEDLDSVVRAQAAAAIKKRAVKITQAAKSLIDRLRDGTDADRERAAREAGKNPNMSSWLVPALHQALEDPNPKVRLAALESYGVPEMGGLPLSEKVIIDKLSDEDGEVRRVASAMIAFLATTEPDEVARRIKPNQLLSALGDSRWEVRAGIATALGDLGDRIPDSRWSLMLLRNDPEPGPRNMANQALQRLGEARPR